MAGFFGLFDYSKPGKGVDVEAPPKKPFFRFFELYWRKFSRFVILSMLMFLFLLPIITVLYQYYYSWYYSILPEEKLEEMLQESKAQAEAQADPDSEDNKETILFFGFVPSILIGIASGLPQPVALFLVAVSVVFYGPVMCGMSYMLRNYVREEHAWMSDFFAQIKKNFPQGLALGLLELFAITMLFLNITSKATDDTASWIGASLPIVKYISIFLLIMILFVRQYMYVMAVTFKLRLIDIIKNSFAFAIAGLPRNFLVVFIEAVLVLAVIFVPYCDVLLLPFFFFSFTGFLTVFACYPLIHKHMLLPALERKKNEEQDQEPA